MAKSQQELRYTVSMGRANGHYIDVVMEVPLHEEEGPEDLRLRMPVWTPGHYLVDDFARHIPEVKAYDARDGNELQVAKLEKSLWSVACKGVSRLRVEYSVYAFVYSVVTSYIDQMHALINGASVFLYPEKMKEAPVNLTVIPKGDWKTVSTGLARVSDWEFVAPNYDVLIDSPLEIGNQQIRVFEAGGAKYEVSIFGSAPIDLEHFVKDIRSIVENTTSIFAHVPYERYVFLVNFTDTTGGGLEHLNSTMCFTPRLRLAPKEEYAQSMGLYSHEFFHAWNVKRLRPVGLGPFDYSSEVYTKSLWIAEGITSYYDDLILRRAGVYTVEEYLDAFVSNVNLMKSFPGSKYQSAEEASFDTWTKYYKPNENSVNVTSSYYTQGAVIGWMLDMVILKATGGEKCLDNAMRKIYEEVYRKLNRGYTDADFESVCVGLGGKESEDVFRTRVKGRGDIDYDRYLGYVGLRLVKKEERLEDKGFLGVKLKSEMGRTTVESELAGSPAQAMGLSVSDEILAVEGYRMGADKIAFSVETTKPGENLRLTIARGGKLMDLDGPIGRKPIFEYRIQPQSGASEDQKALFKRWMLTDWKTELKYPEYSKSPDRKPTFNYV